MTTPEKCFEQLCQHVRQTNLLTATQALLEWDQQTHLPIQASEFRSQQITFFAGEIYRRQTDPRVGDWLGELAQTPLAEDPHSDTGSTIRELQREYNRKTKLPLSLVEELAGLTSRGQTIWVEARQKNDFALFAPTLKQILELKKKTRPPLGASMTAPTMHCWTSTNLIHERRKLPVSSKRCAWTWYRWLLKLLIPASIYRSMS